MRARLRYLTVSPRPIRLPAGAGLVVGLVLAVLSVGGVIVAGMVADFVTHAAAAGIVAVVSL
jgi:hypothetical protein